MNPKQQFDRFNQALSDLGESVSMLQDKMTHYTEGEMEELLVDYPKLTTKQRYLIIQSIRYLIFNPEYWENK